MKFVELPAVVFLAYVLSDVKTPEQTDDQRPQDDTDKKRSDRRHSSTERNVLEDIEK
jgi:hypothetical protein